MHFLIDSIYLYNFKFVKYFSQSEVHALKVNLTKDFYSRYIVYWRFYGFGIIVFLQNLYTHKKILRAATMLLF